MTESGSENCPVESSVDPKLADDIKIVDKLIDHMSMPCRVDVDGTTHDLGYVYIREAKAIVETITDENQKARLQNCINIYEQAENHKI